MCGIAGFAPVSDRATSDDNIAALGRMVRALKHRGPDDHGSWVDPRQAVYLGHTRLSILDISPAGHQPMLSRNGRYVIVFNGEIYNFLELRQELERDGFTFRSHSDTEVILAAAEAWGTTDAIQKLTGMFAFALWDCAEKVLHLCRDRVGEKPLYYGLVGDRFVFGSELRVFRQLPAWQGEINRSALQLYLVHNSIPAPLSIYRGINKLPQATHLQVRLGHQAPVYESRRYWQPVLDIRERDERECEDMLDVMLRETMRDKLHADVPLGVFLSGGIDSSLVAAVAQSVSPRPLSTFTIGFPESDYSEANEAAETARHLGTIHTELVVTESMAMGVVAELATIYDEPLADSSQISQVMLSRLTRGHVSVALSGDGGDELFGGYSRYRLIPQLRKLTGRLPNGLVRTLWGIANYVPASLLASAIDMLGQHKPSHLRYGNSVENMRCVLAALAEDSAEALYQQVSSARNNLISIVPGAQSEATLYEEFLVTDDPRSMMHRDFLTYLPDTVLTKVDRATMSVGLESRAPFLDRRIIEFAYTVPTRFLQNERHGKLLLISLLRRYLPDRNFNQPKKGFNIPLETWLRGNFRAWATDLLDPGTLTRQGFFNAATVDRYWREHLSGKRNWHYHLWAVLMFQAWCREQT